MRIPGNFTAYTIGYEGMTIDGFIASLRAQTVSHLVDIREMPLSRKKGFSKVSLSEHLQKAGIRYSHMRSLGCPRPIRDQYRIDGNWNRYAKAFSAYLDTQAGALIELRRMVMIEPCSLMCFEADYHYCHRGLVAERLGCGIVHLGVGDPVRTKIAAVA